MGAALGSDAWRCIVRMAKIMVCMWCLAVVLVRGAGGDRRQSFDIQDAIRPGAPSEGLGGAALAILSLMSLGPRARRESETVSGGQ